jgi:hypothetical protein
MHKMAAYLYFGYKPLRRQLYFSCLVTCGDFLMVDVVIPTLMTYIHVLATVLGMPLNLLKDVVIRLHGIGSPRLFLFLASFDFLLSLASPGISIPSAALGPRQHHWSFPRAAASGRTPSYVLGAVTDCSGASCTGSGACLSSVAVCSTPGASGGTACSLVALIAADDGPPPVASCSGISVDAKL